MKAPSCPLCNVVLREYVGVTGSAAPEPGDLVICQGCAGYLTFDTGMRLHLISRAYLELLDGDFQLLMTSAREELIDLWTRTHPPTIFAWALVEARRKKEAANDPR